MIGIVLAAVIGYLLGSIPFGVVLTRLAGLGDVRRIGSGSIGATNVLRTGNKAAALLTLFGDGVKGFAAVVIAYHLGVSWGDASLATAGAALAVFIGHLYPIFHRFAGGKGVSTAAGIAFGLSWQLGLAALAVWLAVAIAFRFSSLAAIVTAIATPPLGFYFLGNWPEAWALIPIALLLVLRHRANIRKLLAGNETQIGA
jgi:acyl phosphate:glycerol-3-phosphate acyltransferase